MNPLRVICGELFADIFVDRRGTLEVWMYVVQRDGSPEILALGSCLSEEDARQTIENVVRDLTSKSASAS